jgi:hypothetical protein
MANPRLDAESADSKPETGPALLPPPRPTLPALRFGLRQLFWTIAGLSLLLAALAVVPRGPTPLLVLIAVLVIVAHLTGTAIGDRLRRHANDSHAWDQKYRPAADLVRDAAEHSCDLAAASLPPPSPWFRRGSTSLGWLPKLVVTGAILGGCAGVALFLLTDSIGHRPTWAGIAVGSTSLAVLGGWFAFLGGSFYAIFRHGLHEAMAHHHRDETCHISRR